MIASITQPSTNLYVLVMDAQGKPLALAPMRQLHHSGFPMEQIRLVKGEKNLLETGAETAPSQQSRFDPAFLAQAESALKHLYDLAFLCKHPFSRMQMVTSKGQAQSTPYTCLDRARTAQEMLYKAVEQLRPLGPVPARQAIPRREWHPYLILYRAYVEGEKNYSIMNWLQIGEGTFNRTRRRALQSVAMVLQEMERQAA